MNKKFTISALSLFAIFLSITFANLTAADTTVKDLPSGEINNETLDVLSPMTDIRTTLFYYNFNDAIADATPCNPGNAFYVSGFVTSTFSTSTGTCTTPAGTETSATAFLQIPTAGKAVAITGFATDATQYFQFQLSKSSFPSATTIGDYKVYFQALRNETGPANATFQVSTDGTNFTNVQTVSVPTNNTNTFETLNFNSITVSSSTPNIYFRIVGSGGSDNSGVFVIDNFQVFATIRIPTPTPTPTVTPTLTPTPIIIADPTPQPFLSGTTFYAVTASNQLIRFEQPNRLAPVSATTIIGTITGLQPGENILGIDFRPANGQLYALGSASRLYTINIVTGAATQIGSTGAFTLNGTDFGFDFNASADHIRVVSNTGQNLRLNPNDGTLDGTDTPLNPGTPSVTAAAYSNNLAGAVNTTLYVIDTTTDTLLRQGGTFGNPSPNGGALTTIGSLGFDASGVNGFDISSNGAAYAVLTPGPIGTGIPNLYTINLQTGAAVMISPAVGNGLPLRGLAIAFGSAASGAGRGTALDFDGDRRADFSVFRPGNGYWFIRSSLNNAFTAVQFGLPDDVRTPGDYDGDGRADISVWRPSNGYFFVLRSSDNTFQAVQFGQNGDKPVARDYNGDGRTDFAVARPTGGRLIWYILTSDNFTFSAAQFGFDTDRVAPGDYDGDGRFDFAVYRGSGADRSGPATFYVQRSTTGFQAVQFGLGSDLVVPGDYDGDGRTDFAVVRRETPYKWYTLSFANIGFGTSNLIFRTVEFGTIPELPTQADYDGDGRTDISVWNPQNGTFYNLASSNSAATQVQFGQNGDFPNANHDTH
jgi:hypothetical protein